MSADPIGRLPVTALLSLFIMDLLNCIYLLALKYMYKYKFTIVHEFSTDLEYKFSKYPPMVWVSREPVVMRSRFPAWKERSSR